MENSHRGWRDCTRRRRLMRSRLDRSERGERSILSVIQYLESVSYVLIMLPTVDLAIDAAK